LLSVIVALGGTGFDAVLRMAEPLGWDRPRPKPKFGHGVELQLGRGGPLVVCSFHPSQQNTFTGRLTEEMFDGVFRQVRDILGR
jgi:uracil-DNA glycosylase